MKKPGRHTANPAGKKGDSKRPAQGIPVKRENLPGSRRTVWGVCVFLAAITLAVFGQTVRFDFVNYDDTLYVYENPEVSRGLTFAGLWHAFRHGSPANWDPLTTISHMVDCQLYGLY